MLAYQRESMTSEFEPVFEVHDEHQFNTCPKIYVDAHDTHAKK